VFDRFRTEGRQARAGELRPGWYLVGASPAAARLDGAALARMFSQLMTKIDAEATRE